MGVTIQDLAIAARVSTASVSRVLNNKDKVSAEIRSRVLKTADRLNYVPNSAARALASQRTLTIGAVIPTLENPGFAIGVEALQNYLEAHGYTLFVASSNYDQKKEKRQVEKLVTRGVDGVMLVGSKHSRGLIEFLRQQRKPFVETWVHSKYEDTPAIGFDNCAAAMLLAEYLLDLGHIWLGVIGGITKANDRARDRVRGIRLALKKRGLKLARENFLERPFRIVDGQKAMRTLLAMNPRPTAVMCGNDVLAFGALLECQRQGIAVPDEMSVTGFDNLDFASQLVPSLTTIRIPAAEIGEAAACYLLSAIAGEEVPPLPKIKVDMIVRRSTAPPPAYNR